MYGTVPNILAVNRFANMACIFSAVASALLLNLMSGDTVGTYKMCFKKKIRFGVN